MKSKFALGLYVKDIVTGFSGRVTAIALYLTGSTRYQIESLDGTGRPVEWWFDEERLRNIDELNHLTDSNTVNPA